MRAVQRRLEGLQRGKEGLTECRGETLQVRVLEEPETESWGLKRAGYYKVGAWGMFQKGTSPELKEGAREP